MQSLEELSPANRESADHLSSLLNTVEESIAIFKDLKRPIDHWDDQFNYWIISRLSNYTRLGWIKHAEASRFGDFPEYKYLKSFLQRRIRSLEFENLRNSENKENRQGRFNKSQDNEKFGKKFHNSSAETRSEKKDSNLICTLCNGNHFISYCVIAFSSCYNGSAKEASKFSQFILKLFKQALSLWVQLKKALLHV